MRGLDLLVSDFGFRYLNLPLRHFRRGVDLIEHVDERVFEVALFAVELDDLEAVLDHASEARLAASSTDSTRSPAAVFAGFDEFGVGMSDAQSESACGSPNTWTSKSSRLGYPCRV